MTKTDFLFSDLSSPKKLNHHYISSALTHNTPIVGNI